ncbi:transposase, partial [Gallibacterium salpingitidis]
KLVTEQGYSIPQACLELGIGETALRRWVKQVQTEQQGYMLPSSKPISPLPHSGLSPVRMRSYRAHYKKLHLYLLDNKSNF